MKNNQSAGFGWIVQHSRTAFPGILLVALSSTVGSAVNILTTMILKAFTDYATGTSVMSLRTLSLFSAAIIAAGGIFLVLDSLGMRLACYHTERELQGKLLRSIGHAYLPQLQAFHQGELLTRMTKDTELVAGCIPQLVHQLLGGCLSAVAALVYMVYLSWELTLVVLLCIPVMMLMVKLFGPILQTRTKAERHQEDGIRSQMHDTLDHLPLIQAYQAQPFFTERFLSACSARKRAALSLGAAEGAFHFLNTTTGTLTFVVSMGFGAFLAAQGRLTVGSMIAVVNLLNMVTWPLSNISNTLVQVRQAIVSAERIDQLLKLPAVSPSSNSQKAERITLDGLSFGYPAQPPIFTNLHAVFEKGRLYCIRGASGCGKSTLLKLLLGLYRPLHGSILPSAFSAAYVPSDHAIFPGTIQENIVMGDAVDQMRLERCLQQSNLAELIASMPRGINTQIGKGAQLLSSGQEQRIAIARALYRSASALILDEPTSNLDQESISVLKATLRSVSQEQIVVLVTHDRGLESFCDQLFELCDGILTAIPHSAMTADFAQHSP